MKLSDPPIKNGRTRPLPTGPGGVDGRFRPKMPVIWRPGPWVTAALRTGAPSAALSRGGSYWAHRFFRVGNRKPKPLGGPGTGSTPVLELRSFLRRGSWVWRDAGTHSNAASPGKPGSAFVAGGRSRSAGGAPPRSLKRPFVPHWVVLRRVRVAVPGASRARGSRARSKREPDSRESIILELQNSSSVSSRTSQSVTDVQAHPAAVASSFDASFDLAS